MAIGFNNIGDFAKRLGSPAISMTGDSDKFTMSGWMYIRDITPGATVFNIGVESGDDMASEYFLCGIDSSDDPYILHNEGSYYWSPAPSQDTWYYIYITGENDGAGGVTFDAGYYSATGSSPIDTSGDINIDEWNIIRIDIGNDSYGYDLPLDGIMAQVRVWTGVILSDSELRAERASPTAVRTSGLWADWPLADNTDNGDDSGNGRDLTFGGSLTTETGPPQGVTVTPAAATAIGSRVNPTVVLGSLSITPAAISAIGITINPTVVLGSLSITPAAITAISTTVDPTVVLGSISITPAATSAVATTINPTVVLGSLSITPSAAAAISTTIDPTVVIGGEVGAYNELFRPTFVRQLIPSGMFNI